MNNDDYRKFIESGFDLNKCINTNCLIDNFDKIGEEIAVEIIQKIRSDFNYQ